MRDYLYLWIDEENKCLISSGIELKDIVKHLDSGIVTMKPELKIIPKENIKKTKDITNSGSFTFVDSNVNKIEMNALRELLYFDRTTTPLRNVEIPRLGNKFMVYGHDDGYFLKLFYTEIEDVFNILKKILSKFVKNTENILENLNSTAYYITQKHILETERSFDVDMIQI